MPIWKKFIFYIITLIISILFTIISLEFVLRVFYRHTPLAKIYRYHELLGWSNKEGLSGRFYSCSGSSPFYFNSLGLRNKEIQTKKLKNLFRILILGDSFTAGLEVNNHQTFCAILEKTLNDSPKGELHYQVLNAAVRGWGTDQEFLRLRQLIPLLAPDMVIFQVSDNDFNDISTTLLNKRMYHKPRFILDDNGSLILTGTPTPKINRGFFYYLNHSSTLSHFLVSKYEFIKKRTRFLQVHISAEKPLSLSRNQSVTLFLKLINESKQLTMENGAKIVLFFIGNPKHYQTTNPRAKSTGNAASKIVNRLNQSSVSWFYFDPVKQHLLSKDGHLNQVGHKKLAQLILTKLKEWDCLP